MKEIEVISHSNLSNHRHRCHQSLLNRGRDQNQRPNLPVIQSGRDANGKVQMPVVLSDMPNCPACHIDSVWVVIKRKPLSEVPWLYRWLARWVYFRIGWSSDYSIELIGVYTDKSEAYHAACGNGYAFMEVPLHASLPNETCQYGLHEFPHSEANIQYRGRRLDYVPIERQQLAMLGRKIEEVETCAAGQCKQ